MSCPTCEKHLFPSAVEQRQYQPLLSDPSSSDHAVSRLPPTAISRVDQAAQSSPWYFTSDRVEVCRRVPRSHALFVLSYCDILHECVSSPFTRCRQPRVFLLGRPTVLLLCARNMAMTPALICSTCCRAKYPPTRLAVARYTSHAHGTHIYHIHLHVVVSTWACTVADRPAWLAPGGHVAVLCHAVRPDCRLPCRPELSWHHAA